MKGMSLSLSEENVASRWETKKAGVKVCWRGRWKVEGEAESDEDVNVETRGDWKEQHSAPEKKTPSEGERKTKMLKNATVTLREAWAARVL